MSRRSRPHITAIFVDGRVVLGVERSSNSKMYEQSLCCKSRKQSVGSGESKTVEMRRKRK
jgi:hypothetical protein